MSQITLTNYGSGEILIANGSGISMRLPRESANRLILHARMHGIDDFYHYLPALIPHPELAQSIQHLFQNTQNNSERWGLKEKFARLSTLAKGYEPREPGRIIEEVQLP